MPQQTGEAEKYRDRTEVFALNPEGRIYGGIWNGDSSFAVPGGGVDSGETPLQAAIREFKEETGLAATNPRYADVKPVISPWSERHRATLPEHKRMFSGARTHFVVADLPSMQRDNTQLDAWEAKNKRLYTLAQAIAAMRDKQFMAPSVAKQRLRLLQLLQQMQNSPDKFENLRQLGQSLGS